MRIAAYAKMRIAAPGLRKKFAAEQCSSSGVRIFVKCAELLRKLTDRATATFVLCHENRTARRNK
jgi:hypothetical protein